MNKHNQPSTPQGKPIAVRDKLMKQTLARMKYEIFDPQKMTFSVETKHVMTFI